MPPPRGAQFSPQEKYELASAPTHASPLQQSPVLTRGIICLIPGCPGWLLGCRGAGTHTNFPPICPLPCVYGMSPPQTCRTRLWSVRGGRPWQASRSGPARHHLTLSHLLLRPQSGGFLGRLMWTAWVVAVLHLILTVSRPDGLKAGTSSMHPGSDICLWVQTAAFPGW